jgi:hypothetical protein
VSEPWIRVHANLHAKPVIARAVAALAIGENEAVGLMVRFWGAVSQHVVNGQVADTTDRQLEQWAGWTRKKGRFAAFVRSQHFDTDGRVNEWDEYAGALETRREKDRARKEQERLRKSRGRHADSPQDVTGVSIPARVNETIRNETTTTAPSPARSVWQPAREVKIAERLTSVAGRDAFAAILHVTQSESGKAGVCAQVEMCLAGEMGEPRATAEQMDRAIRDYATNGLSNGGRFNANHFRQCVRTATEPPQNGNGARGGRRGGVGQRSHDNAMEALKDL